MDDSKPRFPPSRDGRKTPRVTPCDLPLRVLSPSDWPPARVLDLSRSGIRLGLAVQDPATREAFSLERLALQMHEHLVARVLVELVPCGGDDPVRRGLRIVRVGPLREAESTLEIGCTFQPPLGDPEVHALRLCLPREGETVHLLETRQALRGSERRDRDSKKPPGLRRLARCVSRKAEEKGAASAPYRCNGSHAPSGLHVQVVSCRRHAPPALCGCPLEFSREGGYAALDSTATRPLMTDDAPVVDTLVAFTRAYGEYVELRVSDGTNDVWAGAARIVSVGILPEMPGRLVLGFTYCRPLVPAEMQALGLTSTAS